MSKFKNKKPVIEEDPEVNTDIKNILMIGVYLPIIYAKINTKDYLNVVL